MNFGAAEVQQPEYTMELPPLAEFKDLHGGMTLPPFTMDQLQDFLHLQNASLGEKVKMLYDDGFANFVRTCHKRDIVYIHAEVRAEMKGSVVYAVDVALRDTATVLESQCECPVGMGPDAHCKHVQVILLGLTKFQESRTFVTVTTCTDRLQTFHQAKKHLHSPVKAQDLKVHGKSLQHYDFDPRPPQFREKASNDQHFRNIMANDGCFATAPIRQLFAQGNRRALVNDHDYLNNDPQASFLTASGLLGLPEETIQKIEEETRGTANKKAWLKARQMRLCSSRFGEVCRAVKSHVVDKEKLCNRMMSASQLRTKAILHGRKFEREAVLKYETERHVETKECGLFVAKSHTYLAATPDRVVGDSALVEVKCPFSAVDKMISPSSVPYLVTDNKGHLALKRSHDYYHQVQGQMFCVGPHITHVDFVVYTIADVKIIKIPRDDEFIDKMVHELEEFFTAHFKSAVLEKFFFRQ
jgi:hypothetical protein